MPRMLRPKCSMRKKEPGVYTGSCGPFFIKVERIPSKNKYECFIGTGGVMKKSLRRMVGGDISRARIECMDLATKRAWHVARKRGLARKRRR